MNRRRFIIGLSAGVCAPAIVPYINLMPVRAMVDEEEMVWRMACSDLKEFGSVTFERTARGMVYVSQREMIIGDYKSKEWRRNYEEWKMDGRLRHSRYVSFDNPKSYSQDVFEKCKAIREGLA